MYNRLNALQINKNYLTVVSFSARKAKDMPTARLKIIPYYTGIKNLDSFLKEERNPELLWLEILLNDKIKWEKYLKIKEVRKAYQKACIWYGNFKTLIDFYVKREPLKIKKSRVDSKDYRKFLEALNFVSS